MPDPVAPAKSEMTVPGVGKVKKKYVGIAVVGTTLVAVLWYRSHKAASATATTATGSVTDPAGNVCSTLDPNSGYCPGSTEDQAYQTSMLGNASATDPNAGLPGTSSSTGSLPGGTGDTPGPGSFTNNAEWSSYCESAMGSNGADAIAAALGKYITGGPVVAAQVTSIDEAIAIGGYPPTQGPGGRPPSINVNGGGPPPPPATKVKVPNVVGKRGTDAENAIKVAGLVPSMPAEKPHTAYWCHSQSPKAGTLVSKGSTVHIAISTKR
jgi:hypothetical protein